MIKILNKLKDKPYLKFYKYYKEAINVDQSHIESIAISSYCSLTKTVNSRFVNLKYIDSNRWTFSLIIILQKQLNLKNISKFQRFSIGTK